MFNARFIRTGLSSAFAVVLAGCASGPDYHTPDVPKAADAAFVTHSPNLDSTQSPPAQWWRLYRDQELDTLVQQALAANTDLRAANANLVRARAIFEEAGSGRYPSTELSAGASYGRDQTAWPGPGKAPKQWSYSGGLNVAYEVDLFGRVKRDIQAAQFDMQAVAATRDAVRLAVVAETTRAYIDTCALGESVDVAKHSLQLAERSLQLVDQRQRAGASTRLDVERAAASRARALAALAPLQGQRQKRLLELAALMGRTPSDIPGSARQCRRVPVFSSSLPIGNGVQLLRRRPDVRAAERRLAADTARIGIAVANLYPHISLGASANYLRNDTLRGDRTWSFGIGPLISWSFPNQVVARSRIRQAKAQSAAALANFDGTVLTALKETEQALVDYNTTLEQRSALAEARDHAKSAYTLAQQRFRAGVIGYLDVLVAQATLIDADAQLIAAEQQLGSRRVSVFLALGGGWEKTDNSSREQQASISPRSPKATL